MSETTHKCADCPHLPRLLAGALADHNNPALGVDYFGLRELADHMEASRERCPGAQPKPEEGRSFIDKFLGNDFTCGLDQRAATQKAVFQAETASPARPDEVVLLSLGK